MRWLVVLAALVAAGSVCAQDVIRNPDWDAEPSQADIDAAYPAKASSQHITGEVVARCLASQDGHLTDCKLLQEAPQGFGFGAATLSLTGKFRLPAVTYGGRRTAGNLVDLYLTFSAPTPGSADGAFLTKPIWDKAPSTADVGKAFASLPPGSRPGQLQFRCEVGDDGSLRPCSALKTGPTPGAYESAARQLLPLFRVGGPPRPKFPRTYVDLVIALEPPPPPGEAGDLVDPGWVKGPTADELAGLPAKAIAAGVQQGRAGLECTADASGLMTNCRLIAEDPQALDFGETALKIAAGMRVDPWTDDGHSVEGVHVQFALTFAPPRPDQWGIRPIPGERLVPRSAWAQSPSPDDFARAWPRGVSSGNGLAQLRCKASEAGAVSGCEVLSEYPGGSGFGAAALQLATKIVVDAPQKGKSAAGPVRLPIFFRNPHGSSPDIVVNPEGLKRPTPDEAFEYARLSYDPKTHGHVQVACTVDTDGRPQDCKVVEETPTGKGFGAAALRVAAHYLWTPKLVDGEPVAGAQIEFGVAF